MKIRSIEVKSVLSKSGLPGSDYVINPYVGCTFGCSYCYADFMRRFTGHSGDKWGSFVDVKVNADKVLGKELVKRFNRSFDLAQDKGRSNQRLSVLIGSVTDPYQGVEAKYQITRKCLEVIAKSNCSASFSILTKSHLVTRDIDVMKKIRNISVGLTITTTDDKVSRLLEGNAPPASLRLKALQKLNKAGIPTYVCVNPLLPHFVASEKNLRKLFDAIQKTGNREVWLEHINLGGNRLERIKRNLTNKTPHVIKYFVRAKTEKYKADLNKLLFRILKDYKFEIGGGGIIDHKRRIIIASNTKAARKVKNGWKVEVIK
jgi:DNA repair photolyase